jgi:hypothetical protein
LWHAFNLLATAICAVHDGPQGQSEFDGLDVVEQKRE